MGSTDKNNKLGKPKKTKMLAELFLTFMKIGFFTIGGGYAMISIIEDNCVEKKKWITHEEMMNVTVIAESTPGPIAINCSTFVGFKQAGFLGACAATLGVVLPSFISIFIIAMFLDNFLEIKLIANAFKGIKCAVGVLIIGAAAKMIAKADKSPLFWGIFGGASVIMLVIDFFALNFSSIALMLAAGAVGLLAFLLTKKRGGEGK